MSRSYFVSFCRHSVFDSILFFHFLPFNSTLCVRMASKSDVFAWLSCCRRPRLGSHSFLDVWCTQISSYFHCYDGHARPLQFQTTKFSFHRRVSLPLINLFDIVIVIIIMTHTHRTIVFHFHAPIGTQTHTSNATHSRLSIRLIVAGLWQYWILSGIVM